MLYGGVMIKDSATSILPPPFTEKSFSESLKNFTNLSRNPIFVTFFRKDHPFL